MKAKIGKVLAWVSVLTMTAALAQPRHRARLYDPAKEVTISGTIDEVSQIQHGRMTGMHVLVKTGTETIDVRLGPSFFISNQGFNFAKGDQVEVVGAKAKVGGADVLIAREVTKDAKKLTLRDANGRPLWAGRRT